MSEPSEAAVQAAVDEIRTAWDAALERHCSNQGRSTYNGGAALDVLVHVAAAELATFRSHIAEMPIPEAARREMKNALMRLFEHKVHDEAVKLEAAIAAALASEGAPR